MEEKYRFRHLFDLEIYSFDYHVTKPDKRFVEIMIEKAGCEPEEIAYVDDNDRYAQPARELGVRVVIYKRGELAKLKSRLAATLGSFSVLRPRNRESVDSGAICKYQFIHE